MIPKLPRSLRNTPFNLKQASRQRLTFHQIQTLLKFGEIEQVARGIYRAPKDDISDEDQFQIATLIAGEKSAICLVSALAHYGVTDLIPKETWILVPNSKRTRSKNLKFFRMRDPQLKIGVLTESGYKITSIERSVVESICYRRIVGANTGIEALRRAIKEKKTTYDGILRTASQLHCIHRIVPIIEALI